MSAIILSGGKSTRMGFDKSHMDINGKSLLEMTVSRLRTLFNEIIICGSPDFNLDLPGVIWAADIYIGLGPIGGIHSGLAYSSEDISFVMACDMPEVDLDAVRYMMEAARGYDICVIQDGEYYEPLFGIYSKRVLHIIENNIKAGKYKVSSLFEYANVRYVKYDEIRLFKPEFKEVVNLNTPEDYEKYLREKRFL